MSLSAPFLRGERVLVGDFGFGWAHHVPGVLLRLPLRDEGVVFTKLFDALFASESPPIANRSM